MSRAPSTSGTTRRRWSRSGWPRRPATSTARRWSKDIFSERFLIRRPLLQALEPDPAAPPVLLIDELDRADEAVRGVSARGARRQPGDDPGARHHPRRRPADRRPHHQPHARDPRRAEAALPLPLGRLSRRRRASSRSCDAGAAAPASGLPREVVAFVQRLRREDLFKQPGVAETHRLGERLTELDPVALDPADGLRHARRAAQVPGRHRPHREEPDEVACSTRSGRSSRRLSSECRGAILISVCHPGFGRSGSRREPKIRRCSQYVSKRSSFNLSPQCLWVPGPRFARPG